MSGEIGYLLMLPLAVMAVPVVAATAAVMAVGKAGKAVGKAALAYEEKRREERQLIRQSGIQEEITGFRKEAGNLMNEQRRQNQELSVQFEKSMEQNRREFAEGLRQMDENMEVFAETVKTSAAQMLTSMDNQQKQLQQTYQTAIHDTLEEADREGSKILQNTLNEIQSIYQKEEQKQLTLRKTAEEYLADARDLMTSLKEQFHGEKYLGKEMILHKAGFEDAMSQYEKGNYESCLIAAGTLMARLRRDILNADEKHQEFENWQKTAYLLITENREMMESQSVLTQEMYETMQTSCQEQNQNFHLDTQFIGHDLTPYWGMTQDGRGVYEVMMEQLNQLEERVMNPDCALSAEELKEITGAMAGDWRMEILKGSRKAMTRFNNAVQRDDLGGRIIDQLEEMGYEYLNFSYLRDTADGGVEKTGDDDMDAHLCMTFQDGFGDEILVELSNRNDGEIGLEITDMAEELDPEIDKSQSRKEMEQAVQAVVSGVEHKGHSGKAIGGCRKGTEKKVVVNPVNRKKKKLVDES